MKINLENVKVAVIGLGYVGLPLAIAFAKKFPVYGFDIKKQRIAELQRGNDHTLEVEDEVLKQALQSGKLTLLDQPDQLTEADVFIITVPTPTDRHNRPVLKPLLDASEMVASVMKKGATIIYESTVYPGATEEDCVPILEAKSGLQYNRDFFVGYSPERINPGDKIHNFSSIVKVTAGSTEETSDFVDALYKEVVSAGTFKASSLKVAEAAKVIENSQRDINIAFVNELSKIFNRLDIDTHEVLEAAGTKWNFLPFRPGLVGGHCIGVDPFYLAQKAQSVGYHPEIILAGRRLNDSMGQYVASEVVKAMNKRGRRVGRAPVLILGITFKENCPDIRNTRVIDIYHELKDYGCAVDVYDPWADNAEVKEAFGFHLIEKESIKKSHYKAIILAVAHRDFLHMDLDELKDGHCVVYDVKSVLPKDKVDARL